MKLIQGGKITKGDPVRLPNGKRAEVVAVEWNTHIWRGEASVRVEGKQGTELWPVEDLVKEER